MVSLIRLRISFEKGRLISELKVLSRNTLFVRGGFVPRRPKYFLSSTSCTEHGHSCCHGDQRMKGLKWVDDLAKTGSWTCHRCLRGKQNQVLPSAAYTTNPAKSPPWAFSAQRASLHTRSSYGGVVSKGFSSKSSTTSSFPSSGRTLRASVLKKAPVPKGRSRVILAIIAIGSIWAFSDDAKHRYMAVKRALRVFYALVRCLREYVFLSINQQLQQGWLHS